MHVCVIYALSCSRLVVVLFSEIHVFSFPHHPRLLATIQTTPNPQGLCEVCSSVDCQVMVYPGHQRGAIQIVVSWPIYTNALTHTLTHTHSYSHTHTHTHSHTHAHNVLVSINAALCWHTHLDFLFSVWSSTAKTWTVPLSLETHKNEESRLKLILQVRDFIHNRTS